MFLLAFRKKLLSMGVHCLDGEVVDVTVGNNNNNMVSAVKVWLQSQSIASNYPFKIHTKGLTFE